MGRNDMLKVDPSTVVSTGSSMVRKYNIVSPRGTLTLADIRGIEEHPMGSVVTRLALLAVDSHGVVLAILAHTASIVIAMNVNT